MKSKFTYSSHGIKNQTSSSRASSKRSFSLVEALLAMTIMGMTLTGILTTFSTALLASKLSEEYSVASSLIGTLHSYTRSGLITPMDVNEGTFPDQPDFTWKVDFVLTDTENLYQVTYHVFWFRGNTERELNLVTYHYYNLEALMEAAEEEQQR